jgi:polysaccharide deacetylase family protein (PEP-CTERM system associated)
MKEPTTRNPEPAILLTIDVEDWFQVENFKPWIPFSSWEERELRVEKNVHKLLDLFDSVERGQMSDVRCPIQEPATSNQQPFFNQSTQQPNNPTNPTNPINQSNPNTEHKTLNTKNKTPNTCAPAVRGTFFILGWIAERLPHMVREIHRRGHEIASHGMNHDLYRDLSADRLKQELLRSKELIGDLTGAAVLGHRAPSFGISREVLSVVREAGFLYDSSYNSFSLHGRYGKMSFEGAENTGIAVRLENNFYEIPISNMTIGNQVIPFGGGAYFRLLPSWMFHFGVGRIVRRQGAYVFYMHPWEVDPEQPRVCQASFFARFKHYSNLNCTESRLERFLKGFTNARFLTCSDYLNVFAKDFEPPHMRN